jgi:hypothetical protein
MTREDIAEQYRLVRHRLDQLDYKEKCPVEATFLVQR